MPASDSSTVLDGRKTCRTVVDALDRLGLPDAKEKPVATVHAGEILCPNGQTPGMVLIGTGSRGDCARRFVRLPDSNIFRGRIADGTPIRGASYELDGASVTSDGTVLLSDGRKIRAVEFQPGTPYRHYDFAPLQHFLVHLAVTVLGKEDRCYRLVNEDLLPGVKWLDYGAVRRVQIRNAKKLLHRIKKLCCFEISWQNIETTLRLAGMQFPRDRCTH